MKKFICIKKKSPPIFAMGIILGMSSFMSFAETTNFEAEKAELIAGENEHMPGIVPHEDASGGAAIEHFQNKSGIEFKNSPESNKMTLHYATRSEGDNCSVGVYIDGKHAVSVPYSNTWSWTAPYKKLEIPVYIPKGSTVQLKSLTNSINIDRVEFSNDPLLATPPIGMLTASEAVLSEGAVLSTDLMSSQGKAASLKASQRAVFSATAEQARGNAILIRYSSPENTTLSVQVNDQENKTHPLKQTGAHVYEEILIEGLRPGEENKIILTGTDDTPVLIDSLSFLQFSMPTPAPDMTKAPQGSERNIHSLNGIWECVTTPDNVTTPPTEYNNRIQVPGLWDIAERSLGNYSGKSLWYRKTILTGELPERVTLRINKAQFGRSLYINGKFIEDYTYNFTASHHDITPHLLPNAENEIVIRLQNKVTQENAPHNKGHLGYDRERIYFWPGIYDDVSIVMSANPLVTHMQVAPDIDRGSIQSRVFLKNTGKNAASTDVDFKIYKLGVIKEGKEPADPELVATHSVKNVTIPAQGEQSIDVPSIALKNYDKARDLWSPDSPALYKLVVSTKGDTQTERFGMRTFRFDAATKQPILNGKPHSLLGTNVAFNRFCDDPMRQALPWKKDWERQLFQEFKDVHFECFRTHSAFLPEKWYETADEMGLMIMDEYPYWQSCGDEKCTKDTVMPEIKTWMFERGMHPCVIVWDIQNESFKPWLLEIWNECRGLDIQNRPGDCGWNTNLCKTDMKESHPYFYSEYDFTLGDMNTISPIPWTFGNKSEDLPLIINEYGWNWLNRVGDPTELGKRSYDYIMPDSTREERLIYHADSLAELTEFWRVGGHCVGILQFCGLSYSLPNQEGSTGDILMPDISTPKVRPYLATRLRDAFNKVGIVITDYTEQVLRGNQMTIPVTVLNDLNDNLGKLDVQLRLTKGEQVLFDKVIPYELAALARVKHDFIVPIPASDVAGGDKLKLEASYTRNGEEVSSIRHWQVLDREMGLAFRKPITASSFQKRTYYWKNQEPNANDGASNTRWESSTDDKSPWITIDLGEKKDLSRVMLDWSEVLGVSYYPEAYDIQVSDDNKNFKTIYQGKTDKAGTQNLPLEGSGRYVRMQVTGKMPAGQCSLWEFDVYAR